MQKTDKYKRLVYNSIIFALGNLTVKAAQFFILPLLTGYLLASEYGIVENVVSTVQDLLMPILTLGLAEALFRFSVNKDNSPEEIITNSFSVILIGVVVFAVGDMAFYFAAKAMSSNLGQTYFLLLIPLFAFRCVKNLLGEFTRGLGKSVIYALSSIIESIATLAVAAALIVATNMGIYGYLIALIAAPVAGIVFISVTVNPLKYLKFRSFNAEKLKSMLKYSAPNVSNSISWWIVQTSSRYLMVYLSVWAIAGASGSQELYNQAWSVAGIYTAASKLPALINVVSSIFLQAWSLSSAQESGKSDHNDFYETVFKHYHPLIFLASTCIMLIVPYVSRWLLQGDFYDGWVYSPLLIMGAVIGCFSAFYGAFFGAYYKSKYSMYTTFIGAGINIIICCIGIPVVAKYIDMQSVVYVAGAAFLLSYLAIFVSRVILSKKLINIKVNWRKFAIELILNFVLAVIYTFNFRYKLIIALIAIAIMIAINFREYRFIVKQAFGMLKRFIYGFRKNNKNGERGAISGEVEEHSPSGESGENSEKEDKHDREC